MKLLGKENGLPVKSVLMACTAISYVELGLRSVRVKFLWFLSRPRTNMYKGKKKKKGWLYLAVKDAITWPPVHSFSSQEMVTVVSVTDRI